MKQRINMEKLAKGLGAERRGKVVSTGGYWGALGLLADVQSKFRTPKNGGRMTNPAWTKRRLLPMSPRTLRQLQEIARLVSKRQGKRISEMQVAGTIVETMTREQFALSESSMKQQIEKELARY